MDELKVSGYPVKDKCEALGFARSSYYAHRRSKEIKKGRNKKRDSYLLKRIEKIKDKHPFWGYRRVWARLRYREGLWLIRKRF